MDTQDYLSKVLLAYIKAGTTPVSFVELLAINYRTPIYFKDRDLYFYIPHTYQLFPVLKLERKYSEHFHNGEIIITLPANKETTGLLNLVPAKGLEVRTGYVNITFILETHGDTWLLLE